MRSIVLNTALLLNALIFSSTLSAQQDSRLFFSDGVPHVDSLLDKKGIDLKVRYDSLDLKTARGTIGPGLITMRDTITDSLVENGSLSRCVRFMDTLHITNSTDQNQGYRTITHVLMRDSTFYTTFIVERPGERTLKYASGAGPLDRIEITDTKAELVLSKESSFTHNRYLDGYVTMKAQFYVNDELKTYRLTSHFRCKYVDADMLRMQEDLKKVLKGQGLLDLDKPIYLDKPFEQEKK